MVVSTYSVALITYINKTYTNLYPTSEIKMQYDPYKHKAKTVEELSYPWGFNVPIDTERPVKPCTKCGIVKKCKCDSS